MIRAVAPREAESKVLSSIVLETLGNSRFEAGGERGILLSPHRKLAEFAQRTDKVQRFNELAS